MIVISENREYEVYLCDDGTLDTVISVDDIEHRFDCEYASQFRFDSGEMSEEGLKQLALEAIEDDERHW